MYEMLTGFLPFIGNTHKEVYENIKKRKFSSKLTEIGKNITPEAVDLIDKMLKTEVNKRISI